MRFKEKIEELRKIKTVLDIPTLKTAGKIANAIINSQSLILKRIKERESSKVELKASFRYDMNIKKPNPKILEKVIAKTIAAFMNTEGGTLFIGVDDKSNPVGLQNDFETLKKQNSDGFEIEVRQSIEKYTKKKVANDTLYLCFIQ